MYSSDIKARLFDAQLPIQISCIPVHVKDSQNPSNVSVFHHTHFISIKIDNLIFRNVIFSPKEYYRNSKPKFIPCSDWRSLQGSLCLVKNSRWPPYTITNQLHYNKQVLVLKWSVPVGNTELKHRNIAIIKMFLIVFLFFFAEIFQTVESASSYLEVVSAEENLTLFTCSGMCSEILFYFTRLLFCDYFLFFITYCLSMKWFFCSKTWWLRHWLPASLTFLHWKWRNNLQIMQESHTHNTFQTLYLPLNRFTFHYSA